MYSGPVDTLDYHVQWTCLHASLCVGMQMHMLTNHRAGHDGQLENVNRHT